MVLGATLSDSAGTVHLNFSLKPVPFCKLSSGQRSISISAIFLLDSCFVLAVFSFVFASFSHSLARLVETIRYAFFYLPAVVLGHSFFRDNNTANELVRRGALLQASTANPIFLSLFSYPSYPLISSFELVS